jgi:hypothetical protein
MQEVLGRTEYVTLQMTATKQRTRTACNCSEAKVTPVEVQECLTSRTCLYLPNMTFSLFHLYTL